jgi:hypothetical protein
MAKCFFQRNTVEWVPAQHFRQQIDAVPRSIVKDLSQSVFPVNAVFLNSLSELPPVFMEKLRPVVFGRVADSLADELELVRFRVSLEKWYSLLQKLSDYAANGPSINSFAVFLDLNQQFGSSVPEGDYFAREGTIGLF